jgi:hypothetical protein
VTVAASAAISTATTGSTSAAAAAVRAAATVQLGDVLSAAISLSLSFLSQLSASPFF